MQASMLHFAELRALQVPIDLTSLSSDEDEPVEMESTPIRITHKRPAGSSLISRPAKARKAVDLPIIQHAGSALQAWRCQGNASHQLHSIIKSCRKVCQTHSKQRCLQCLVAQLAWDLSTQTQLNCTSTRGINHQR